MINSNWLITISVLVLFSCSNEESIEYFDDGKIKRKCQINRHGDFHGECVKYFPTGEIESICMYEENHLEGKSRYFHRNGILSWEADYADGRKSGCIDYFDSTGNRYLNACFENNLLNGESLTYFPSGKLKIKSNFKDGIPKGLREIFDPNGVLRQTIRFNEKGNIVDYESFNERGEILDSFIRLNISSSRDKENYEIKIAINSPVGNELGVILGDYSFKKKQLTDTFEILSGSSKSSVKFRYSPDDYKGKEVIEGIVLDLESLENNKAVLKRRRVFKYDLVNQEQIYDEITF